MKKRFLGLLMVCAVTFSTIMSGAAYADETEAKSGEDATLNIAYQYGLGYAPVTIAQDQKLIEAAYKEATGADLEITWTQMSSGADINTAIASGDIDAGFMGVGPAVSGIVSKLGYRIFTNLSGQEHQVMSNDPDVKSLTDLIGSDKQLALVNIGSIQHIILAEALAARGEDPHALDANIVAMKHPDGMAALESGAVAAHLTSNPFLYEEQENKDLHQVDDLSDVWTNENSFLVGICSEKLHDETPDLYNALCEGIAEGQEVIAKSAGDAAKITASYDGNDEETEAKFLEKGTYNAETRGIGDLAKFMFENGFIDSDPGSYEDLVFDNVKGD